MTDLRYTTTQVTSVSLLLITVKPELSLAAKRLKIFDSISNGLFGLINSFSTVLLDYSGYYILRR